MTWFKFGSGLDDEDISPKAKSKYESAALIFI